MLSQAIRIVCFLVFISCDNHDAGNSPPKAALAAAKMLCHQSTENMQWFKTLLQEAQTDHSLRGDIYAIPVDGDMYFIHQPMIMSCLACVIYDCEGNKIPPHTMDYEKIQAGMKPANLIYKAY